MLEPHCQLPIWASPAQGWKPALRAGKARGPGRTGRDRSPVAALGIHAGDPEVRRTPLTLPRAARRDGARSGEDRPRPVPGRSTRDSRWRSRGSPNAAASLSRCAPGRRAIRGGRTATSPRSQHSGFTLEIQRFAERHCLSLTLRAGTARGPGRTGRDRSPVAALGIHAGDPEVRRMPLTLPRAARRDGARSGEDSPRSVPGRSTRDSRWRSRGSPSASASLTLRAGTARGPGDGAALAGLGLSRRRGS